MTRRRFLLGSCMVIAAFLILAVLTYLFVLPWVVRRQIEAALADVGLQHVSFKVRQVTPWGLELRDFQAGEADPGRVAKASADYTIGMLRQKRIGAIRLSGVDIGVSIHDGRVAIEPLSAWRTEADATGASSRPSMRRAPFDLPFERIDLESSSVTLRLPKQTFHAPAHGSFARQGDGRFRAELVLTLEGRPLQLAGTLGPLAGDFDLTASVDRLDAAVAATFFSAFAPAQHVSATGLLDVAARTQMSDGKGDASLSVHQEAVSIAVSSADASRPPTNLQGISGVILSEAAFGPGVPMRGALTLQDVAIILPSAGVTVEKLGGVVHFDDLKKIVTQANQSIGIGKMTVGKMAFAGGSVLFAMNGPHVLDIRRTQWAWLGGTVAADGVHLDFTNPVINATVQIDNIDLGQLLALLSPDKASGSGKVSGRVPVIENWPDLRFGTGGLQAAPGGTLQVKDLAALAAALQQAGQSVTNEVKQKVFEALANFQYDVLRADLTNESGKLAADVHIAGRGRTGARQAVDLDVRIHGLDDLLKIYLGFEQHRN